MSGGAAAAGQGGFSSALGGAGLGASLGSAAPGLGTAAGAGLGAGVGLLGGGLMGLMGHNEQQRQQAQAAMDQELAQLMAKQAQTANEHQSAASKIPSMISTGSVSSPYQQVGGLSALQ